MRLLTTPLRQLLAHGVLALLLLLLLPFSQQQAVLHGLSHSIEATQGKAKGAPLAAHDCDVCAALVALGGAAPAASRLLPASTACDAAAPTFCADAARAVAWPVFRSRTRPVLS